VRTDLLFIVWSATTSAAVGLWKAVMTESSSQYLVLGSEIHREAS
jgi:hypothetical protein